MNYLSNQIDQIEKELESVSEERYTKSQIDSLLERLKIEYISQIRELEKMLTYKDMKVDALKRESDLIWNKYINEVAELNIEIKELHERYEVVLDHERAIKEKDAKRSR